MQLQGAIGVSLTCTRGNSESVRVTLNRSLTIANERGDALDQVKLLATLLADREQRESARALLESLLEQFAEGFDTANLKAAERLLINLGLGPSSTRAQA